MEAAVTAYSMTMSAAVVTFGGAPTDKWAAYNWNAFKWGQGTATIPFSLRAAVNANLSVASTAAVNWRFVHLLSGETILPAGATVNFRYRIGMSSTVTPTDILEHAYIQDSNDYFRVFPEDVTDLTLRSNPTWTRASSAAVSWSTAIAASTVWS